MTQKRGLNMKNKYFKYLCDLVENDGYLRLLEKLHSIEFYSLVPHDDNRSADGEKLREIFIDELGPQAHSFLPKNGCSVLEMMIGVAKRLEFDLCGSFYEKSSTEWFWVLIDNLGFSDFSDQFYDIDMRDLAETEMVKCLLERRYSKSGEGSLFPLKKTKKDMRNVEIWYQMSEWIIENYPV
jgi:hypothetical protein